MVRLPSRNYSDTAANEALLELKKGNKQALGEFIWQNQERFYTIAYVATLDPEQAERLTMEAFRRAYIAVKQINAKQLQKEGGWEWLSEFIVEAILDYHDNNSPPPPENASEDPSLEAADGIDYEAALVLNSARVKKAVASLNGELRNVYLLRHQLDLSLQQIVDVLNEHPDNITAWLHRARSQLIKALGKG